ncbi:MAG: OmcA/MtrC family decaheme c-type cytochrome, partial [Proteobacteria bacterium]|nr:OmcA/MtrC family decaheme c-type cytochrome [Pseudomonadota bacterium]
DAKGNPLKGLPAADIRFAIAQLQPVTIGPNTSSQWRSYITTVEQPAATIGWGTTPQVQATAEVATAGTFTDNGDGTYTYVFSKDLPTFAAASTANGVALSYDGTLTHRVGLEIRGTAATPTNNAPYTWVPSTGSTTNLPLTREIVSNTECDACHTKFAMHGGPRIDVQYCVICHNSGTTDAQSGNTLDFKVLAHKVHMGLSLPSVVAAGNTTPAQGVGYTIFGFGGSANNFNTVVWPQDKRNCTTCHNTSDTKTPDAANYKNIPYAAACTACHDTTDFASGANHGPAPGIAGVTDTDCITCHGPTSGLTQSGQLVRVVEAHAVPELDQLANYQFVVVKAEPTTDAAGLNLDTTACPGTGACLIPVGDYVRVTMKVVDGSGNPLSLTASPGFRPTDYVPGATATSNVTAPSVTVDIAYPTSNFTGPANGQNTSATRSPPLTIKFLGYASTKTNAVPAGGLAYAAPTYADSPANTIPTATTGQPPTQNADGSYTRVSLYPVTTPTPTSQLIGINGNVSGAVFIEGRAVVNVAAAGATPDYTTVGVTSAGPSYFPISLPSGVTQPAARRAVVDMNNCNKCHKHLQMHGDGRNSPANGLLCTSCHNPEMSTGSYPAAAGQAVAGPMDFKYFIHGIHSANYNYGSHNFTATAALPAPAKPLVLDFNSIPLASATVNGVTNVGGFPGVINDCEVCHTKGANTFYPVDPAKVFSTTVWGGAAKGPADDVA